MQIQEKFVNVRKGTHNIVFHGGQNGAGFHETQELAVKRLKAYIKAWGRGTTLTDYETIPYSEFEKRWKEA